MIMNGKYIRIWKDVIMAYFNVLFQHLCEGTEEYSKEPQDRDAYHI
jgi:hypothetical protein